MPLILLLIRHTRYIGTNRDLFCQTSHNLNQNSAALWHIFSSNKSAPAVIRTSRRLDSFFYEAAQNFEVVSNSQS
jgi:hypothetical protein